jgi:aspartyl-tRNA(Asn)/glutamyl-tRNA(Gln) amidotransferase subunit A
MKLNELSIKQCHEGLVKKEFSSEELTKACFQEIKKRDKGIHAFLFLDEEGALEQARNVDKKIKNGEEIGILEGVPVAIKDNILIKDIPCTAGSKILENYIAVYDATVIKKLKSAGAVFLGKTNMDEFAMGSSTENSAFGVTKNPHNLKKVPGGSSGGSAAAVAANMCIYALGSDTGGSIRQPASLCGVCGFKPTYGRVSRFGLIAMASSLDQIGPFAKNVEDLKYIFEAIAGPDNQDATSLNEPLKTRERITSFKNLKVGVPKEYFVAGMEKEVEKKIRETISKMEKAGAKIIDVSLPHSEYGLAVYYIIMPAEASSNLARYDGIRYGYSKIKSQKSKVKNLIEVYCQNRGEGFGKEVIRRIMLGTYVLSAGYYEAYYKKAQQVRTLIHQDFLRVFQKVDCLVTPTSPSVAWDIGEKFDDPLTMYLSDIYTVTANIAGIPAVSIPCGESRGLPVGLQILGNQMDDEVILDIAELCEKII